MDMAMFPPKIDLQNHTTDLTWPMGYSLLIPGSSDKTFFLLHATQSGSLVSSNFFQCFITKSLRVNTNSSNVMLEKYIKLFLSNSIRPTTLNSKLINTIADSRN